MKEERVLAKAENDPNAFHLSVLCTIIMHQVLQGKDRFYHYRDDSQ